MDLKLQDKVVLVSGSSRGLGQEIARTFLEEGARLVLTGRKPTPLKSAYLKLSELGEVEALRGDLTRPSDIQKIVSQTLKIFGRIDILVACVGDGRGPRGWQVDDDLWEEMLSVNLLSSFRLAKAVIPSMIESKGGSIVFITSIAGHERLGASIPYGSAKAALLHLTKELSADLAPHNIRVNAVTPGNILASGGSWAAKLAADSKRVLSYIDREVPMKRFASPAEIADVVAFVASPRAAFMTGASLVVDGGQTRSL
jgi:3-oxoacyl-[acyl-carrier protein] reductase